MYYLMYYFLHIFLLFLEQSTNIIPDDCKYSLVAEGGPWGALDPPEFFRTDAVKVTTLVF